MGKTVFLLTGFYADGRTAASDQFSELRKAFSSDDHTLVPVDIPWTRSTHSRYVKRFTAEYSGSKSDHTVVVGNSFGAVAALLSAPLFKPDVLILCSLSAYFAETLRDKVRFEYGVKHFGVRRVRDLRQYSIITYAELVNQLDCKIVFCYGQNEKVIYPWLVEFTKKYSSYFTNSSVVEIPDAGHALRDPAYHIPVSRML